MLQNKINMNGFYKMKLVFIYFLPYLPSGADSSETNSLNSLTSEVAKTRTIRNSEFYTMEPLS